MKQQFLKLEQATTGVATALACAMLAVAASLGLFQIITRFILEQPAEWTEVLIRFSLIWMVFLGVPMAFRQGSMVSVDVVYRWSSPTMRRVLDAVVSIAALSLVFIIIFWGFQYAQRGTVQTVIGLEGISMLWAYLAMPIGGLFCVIAIIGNYLDPKREELETAQ
jgi:TRAP-type C4-dicarboxylate transport system permease small subunit